MKIYHFSDTHQFHESLTIPEADLVVFSGDCSNPRDPFINEYQVRTFIDWFAGLNIKHKIFVAGNHDTSIEAGLITKKDFTDKGIHYLFNDSIEIEGYKIWGSPYTPTFCDWAFMKARNKINRIWETIPNDTDIIISHGPPKGILDLTINYENNLEQCGCSALRKRVLSIEPKLVMFGHIHNCQDIINAGTLKLSKYKTIFSNGTIAKDGDFAGKSLNNGNLIEL